MYLFIYRIKLFLNHSHQHWSVIYVIRRLYRVIYNIFVPGLPWLPLSAIKYLKSNIKKQFIGLEFGSGNSTFFFSKLCKQLISYENNYLFYRKISKVKNNNVKLIFDKNYPLLIKQLRNNYFDFCLIDGIDRDVCCYNVLSKLKKRSILILDNINWYIPFKSESPHSAKDYSSNSKWKLIFKKLNKCKKIIFDDGISCTMIIIINKKNKHFL